MSERERRSISFTQPMRIPSVTQQMHRIGVNRYTGKSYIYDGYEIKVARGLLDDALLQHRPSSPFSGPLRLEVTWYYKAGKTHRDMEYKTTRPDTDNLIKMLKDEMARLGYFFNDAQVAEEISRKIWTDSFEGISVYLGEMTEEAPECLRPNTLR